MSAQNLSISQPGSKTIIATYNPAPIQFQTIVFNNDTFIQIISNGCGTTTVAGSPALPVLQKQILSSLAVESIEIISCQTEEIKLEQYVIPFFLNGKRSDAALNYHFDSAAYSTNSFFPESFINTSTSGTFSGMPVFDIQLYPVLYNPVSSKAIIIKSAVIKLNLKSDMQYARIHAPVSTYTNQHLLQLAINGSLKSRSGLYPPTLLIVTHPSLFNIAGEFAEWKMKMGIKTHILLTTDISMNPEASDIKTRIKDIHDTFSFDHMLIIGDVSLVPAFYGINNSLNDHEYATLDSIDYLPDFAIGRFPVFNENEGRIEIRKSINYERYPDIGPERDWFNEATVAASNAYLDNSHGIHMCKFFKSQGFDTIDDLRAQTATFRYDLMQKSFTNGRSWVFYIGHGEPTYWSVQGNYSTGSLDYLYNDNKLPMVVSVACYTAKLDHTSLSLGEKWLSLAENRGGVAYIGATALTEFFYSDTLGKHSIFGYFDRTATTIGSALNYGKLQMYNYFPGGNGSITHETMQQFLLLGDPTLMPWTKTPEIIQVDYKKHLKPGKQTLSFKVSSDSIPVQDALVCLYSQNFSVYHTAYTDSAGQASFEIEPSMNSTYYITISGYNLVCREDSIRFDTTNSIQSFNENLKISIYPNPVTGFCTISSNSIGNKIKKIELYDPTGKCIRNFENIDSYVFTFFREDLIQGVYLVRITDNKGTACYKKIMVH